MDQRRKTIGNLEEKRIDARNSLNLMLKNMGETLLARLEDGENRGDFPGDLTEYRRLLNEMEAARERIRAVEADALAMREVEEDIQHKERAWEDQTRKLAESYTRLGELALEEPALAAFAAPYRKQLDSLLPKIKSLEERLEELEAREGGNVIRWIGKGAQGMVIRSFLGKNQGALQRTYASAGEQFFRGAFPEVSGSGELGRVREETAKIRENLSTLEEELTLLRGERRKLGESFGVEGSPLKQIQGLEKHLLALREQLNAVYAAYGKDAADGAFDSFLEEGDRPLLEAIGTTRKSIGEYEVQIEKLKAAIAIDDERKKIARMEGIIENQKRRIAASEGTIVELEEHIAEANRHIQQLQKI
jgi:tetratricopeptide (TPR) repeat protein